ncbi:MAG: hypothetical protein QGF90_12710, partial [Gammaproteobacteria bacterium]|nr:hypothetical protein [Gammaproteobacteria bacterium]
FFTGTDFNMIFFEPDTLGNPVSLADARNLSQMTYFPGPSSLPPASIITLRDAFKKAGFRQQEREITYAIKHTERIHRVDTGFMGMLESLFNYIFFELTTGWGMNPGHALRLLFILIVVFTIPYSIAVRSKSSDGIWRVWTEERMRQDTGTDKPELIRATRWYRGIPIAFYFSILSAFQIGRRNSNVGNWITRIQQRE